LTRQRLQPRSIENLDLAIAQAQRPFLLQRLEDLVGGLPRQRQHQGKLLLGQLQHPPRTIYLAVAVGHLQQAECQPRRGTLEALLLQGDEGQAQLVAHQQGELAPVRRLCVEQSQQDRLGDPEQGGGALGEGVMGARLAIEQADLAEPVWRLYQGQQGFLAFGAHRTDADGPRQHRIQPARRIAALEQAGAGGQPAQACRVEQAVLQGWRQLTKPVTVQQLLTPGVRLVHPWTSKRRLSGRRQT